MKTTILGMSGYGVDYILLVVNANMGSMLRMCKEHLQIAIGLVRNMSFSVERGFEPSSITILANGLLPNSFFLIAVPLLLAHTSGYQC